MTLTVAMANPSLSFEFVLCGDMLLSQLKEYRTQDVCYGSWKSCKYISISVGLIGSAWIGPLTAGMGTCYALAGGWFIYSACLNWSWGELEPLSSDFILNATDDNVVASTG